MSAAPTMTAPAMIPAIAPPERPLLDVVAAVVGCGVDVGEVGGVDIEAAGEVLWDEDAGGESDCGVVATDEADGVVAEEEDGVVEEEV
jgi:hypothetical protein